MKEFHTLIVFKIPTSRLTLSLIEKLLSHVRIKSNAFALSSNQQCPCKAARISCCIHCHPKSKVCNNHEEAATQMDIKKEEDYFITHVGNQTYSPTVLNRKRLQSLDHDK